MGGEIGTIDAAEEDDPMALDSGAPGDISDSSTESEQPIIPTTGFLRLPAELIIAILELASESDRAIPVVFSCLNSALRQLVTAKSSLWTHIDIMDGRLMTEVRLARSGSTPLHVRIAPLPTISIDEGCRRIDEFSQILAPHVPCVRSLDIESVHPQWVSAAISHIESGNWETLDFLGVKVTNRIPSLYGSTPDCDISRVVCMARRLHLQGIADYLSSSAIFSNVVRELHLTEVSGDLALDALGAMPELEHLVLRHLPSGLAPVQSLGERMESSPLVHLAALRRVELVSETSGYLLTPISAPNLETLALGSDALIVGVLLPFLERTEHLRNLEISNCHKFPWMHWRHILRTVPSLARLRLCGTMACTEHLGVLVAEPDSVSGGGLPHQEEHRDGILCPNLEELVLDNEYEVGSDVVRRIVSSRLASNGIVSTIRSVVMRGWAQDYLRKDDVEEIRRQVEHFVLETWDTGRMVQCEDDDELLSPSREMETESEKWELASGDIAVVQGLVHAFP
ncbi:hypothetical protein FRB99_005575 [Tulasnella sp. 403]|nr:hypothetical protein FRB99_005575 [Tulasnella sp. 403]